MTYFIKIFLLDNDADNKNLKLKETSIQTVVFKKLPRN